MKLGTYRMEIFLSIVLLAVLALYLSYRFEMRSLHQRLVAGSELLATRHGLLEYTTWGSGPAVLVLHGAGGGYDQGNILAKTLGGEGFRWIVPSRFGYLRSELPVDASTASQADALAELLEFLEIERVAILSMSGGVPPSLQFALRYPSRTSALALLSSAPFTPMTTAQQNLPVPIWVYQTLFSFDFPYWILVKTARPFLERVFDLSTELRTTATQQEMVFVNEMIDAFQPVTMRMTGVGNEGAAIALDATYPIENIRIPSLVVHARDDGINPFAFGQYTARHIPNAQFMSLDTGGHLLVGHHAEIESRVNAFLRDATQNVDR